MQTLPIAQTEQTSGGIILLGASSLGPLAFSFGAGYAIGTYIYDNWIS